MTTINSYKKHIVNIVKDISDDIKIDVLHVIVFSPTVDFSIMKIINNITLNSRFNHTVISQDFLRINDIDFIRTVKKSNAKVIHLHNCQKLKNLMLESKIDIPTMQTLHGPENHFTESQLAILHAYIDSHTI